MFVVAGMFGNVLNLRHLANQIGADRPFYGIQARGLFGDQPPHETFEEMAKDYLSEVRRVQANGPYVLGGFSGGGIAAFEMARQLREHGEEIALLALLDTPAPTPRRHLSSTEMVRLHLQNTQREGLRYLGRWLSRRTNWRREQKLRHENAALPTPEGSLHSTVIETGFMNALARYRLQPLDTPVNLFRPKRRPSHVFGPGREIDEDRNFLFPDNEWSAFCPAVHITEVPGDHDSMVLEPNVRVLAAHLREATNHALSAQPQPNTHAAR
jgi:thioesterase domain-containing protein